MRTAGAEMRKLREAGFSLVELLTVVVIILILAAVGIPTIAQFLREYHIRGALQEVRGTLQDARVQAIAYNLDRGATFVAIDNTSYQWVIEDRRVVTGAGQTIGEVVDVSELLGAVEPGQSGPVHHLPGDVVFATSCPGFAGGGMGLRFNHLGMTCQPGVDCDAIDAGAPFIGYDGVAREARVCLEDPRRRLQRTIRISGAGHAQQEEQP